MDENFIVNQVYAFVMSNIAGIIWLGFYDVLKFIRCMTIHNRVVTTVCDMVFWIFGVGLVIIVALMFNQGFIRSYLFFGMFFGALLYMLTIGNLLKHIARFTWKKLRPIVGKIKHKFGDQEEENNNL